MTAADGGLLTKLHFSVGAVVAVVAAALVGLAVAVVVEGLPPVAVAIAASETLQLAYAAVGTSAVVCRE